MTAMAEVETASALKGLSRSDQNDNEKTHEEFEEGDLKSEVENNQSADETPDTHPLEHAWTFWFDDPSAKSKQAAWGSSIHPLQTFSTVEDFWSVYDSIDHRSKLVEGADFYCFKDKIEPKWEDPVYANGGKWTIICPKGESDMLWLYTLFALIGEQFDYGDEICGAVVNVWGEQERVSIWTKNAHNEAAQISIGKQWKEFLYGHDTIGFIVHEDAKTLDTNAKNRYTA